MKRGTTVGANMQSPNLSNIQPGTMTDSVNLSGSRPNNASLEKSGGGNSGGQGQQNSGAEDDMNLLKNLDSNPDMDRSNSIGEEEEENDEEHLLELEKRREELLEEFMELALMKKHEAKAEAKAKKTPREEAKRIEKEIDEMRKSGIKELKKYITTILEEQEEPRAKLNLWDSRVEEIKSKMQKLLEPPAE